MIDYVLQMVLYRQHFIHSIGTYILVGLVIF